MQNILCLSYGKDSIACLGAIEQLGWSLDRIVHVEIWATESIPADLPPMVAFKEKADEIIKERWEIEVEHIRSRDTYEDCFYRICGNCGRASTSKRAGSIYGWPHQRGPWCNSRLKQHTLEKLSKNARYYIGIAADEPERFHVLGENKISPLVEAGWTERDCWAFDEQNGNRGLRRMCILAWRTMGNEPTWGRNRNLQTGRVANILFSPLFVL